MTALLLRWKSGDAEALRALIPLVYADLRRTARQYLSRERAGHTLQSTALVHEAYVRLANQQLPQWHDRAHFFAVAAQVMRQIVVDYARARKAGKRGGDLIRVPLDDAPDPILPGDLDVLALDDALSTLATMDAQQGRIVELKYFVGLTNEQVADVLEVSPATVKRDWLHRELSGSLASAAPRADPD